MEGVHINTSQNVSIDYNLGDIGNRILARILDGIFQGIYIAVLMVIFAVISENSNVLGTYSENRETISVILIFVVSLPVVFYSLWAPYFMQGQTFGKKILSLRIVKADGSEAGFGTYFTRWLLNIVDSLFYSIVGLIVMASNQKRQRVADLVAGTVVISTKQTYHVNQTVLTQVEEEYQPKFTQVLQLSDKDIQIISSSMQRARMTMDYNLVKQLRNKIETVIHEYRPEMSDIVYVETVIKDYQYFSQQ